MKDLTDGLLRIVPTAAQPPGTQLVFEYNEICEPAAGTTSSTAFRVVEPVAVVPSLGKLRAALTQGPVEVWVSTGECTLPVEAARADLEVTLSTEAAPLASVLRYELMVDGEPAGSYFARTPMAQAARLGASVLGPGRDRVYALCGTTYPRTSDLSKNLSHGKHSVQMVGILPDNTRVLSDTVEVDLTCTSTPADGGLTDASEGGLVETADGSSRDGGSSDATDGSRSDGALTDAADGSFVDGGPSAVTDSARSDGGPTEVASNPGDSGGCACNLAVPGTARTSGWLLSMALAGLAFRRRRGNPITR